MEYLIIGYGRISSNIIKKIDNQIWKDDITFSIVSRHLENIKKTESVKSINIMKNKIDIEGENIILTIPPSSFDEVSKKFVGQANTVISFLPEKNIKKLKSKINSKEYLRVMPNISLGIESSINYLYTEDILSGNTKSFLLNIGNLKIIKTEEEFEETIIPFSVMPAIFSKIFEDILDNLSNKENKENIRTNLLDGLESYINSSKEMNNQEIITSISTKNGITEKILKKYQISNIPKELKFILKNKIN